MTARGSFRNTGPADGCHPWSVPDEAHRYKASLRVFSRSLGAGELTRALGEPTKSHDAGDPVSRHRPNSTRHKTALWLLESGIDETAPLDQHIAALLDRIDARRADFDAIRQECEIDIFCGIFSDGDQGGFTLEPDIIRRLAEVGLALGFDIY
jgi:hypothetical protein